jgi:hypothetical protein
MAGKLRIKVQMAWPLRRETTVSTQWIADQLAMG